MPTFQEKVQDFLAQPTIAVVGLSRTEANPANMIYKKLRGSGHTVYAINPHATSLEGDPCYPNVAALPQRPEGVVIVTKPDVTAQVVQECAAAGIRRVWLHASLIHGGTSFSPAAVATCQQHGISVIEGGCPMMFAEPVDFGHQCMRWLMRVTGDLPK
ncbi:MAG: CoA-binding protein [Anaerolineae bacterium]|nr:CoA-binding protein [Anaerolineae bacterium]